MKWPVRLSTASPGLKTSASDSRARGTPTQGPKSKGWVRKEWRQGVEDSAGGAVLTWGGAQKTDLSVQEGREGVTWRPLVEEKLGATKLMFSLIGSLIKGTVPTHKCVQGTQYFAYNFQGGHTLHSLTCTLQGKKINTQN